VSGSPLSRRAVLRSSGVFGVLGAAVLSGCDLDPTSSSAPPQVAPPDPDQDIVDSARAELTTLIVRLSATHGAAALVGGHRVQLAALDGEPPPARPRAHPLSHSQVVERERRAADRFARWSLTCENGDLARVLASIATGIRMQTVVRTAPS
jgi:hypothetical protein